MSKSWRLLATVTSLETTNVTSGNSPQDLEQCILALVSSVMSIYQPTDHSVEQNDECRTESSQKEEELLLARILLRCKLACVLDKVQHEEGSKPHRGVQVGSSKVLQCVDHHLVCDIASVETRNTH
jgi:hypothetical protein